MQIIRLQRTGKKNQADFRIVLAEKIKSASKKIQEVLGTYNPRKKLFKVNEERVKYWLSKKIAMSKTLTNLFVSKGLYDGKKVKAFSVPKKKAEEVKPVPAKSEKSVEQAVVENPVAVEQSPMV